MSDKDAATPRLFLIRHGETEWSRSGRYTGVSDIPLLPEGEQKVRQTASVVFGPGCLIDPERLSKIICSPRKRAQQTLEILLDRVQDASLKETLATKMTTTDDIAEWGYGDYEGLHHHQIQDLRRSRGLDQDRDWDIWRDGCEGQGGESPAQVTERLDRLISQVTTIHQEGLQKGDRKCDAIVVAHGHILRAFVKRWLKFELSNRLELMLEPGGVCGLSYAHGEIEKRAVLVGMSFPGALGI